MFPYFLRTLPFFSPALVSLSLLSYYPFASVSLKFNIKTPVGTLFLFCIVVALLPSFTQLWMTTSCT